MPHPRTWTLYDKLWLAIFAAILGVEAAAVLDDTPGGSLSEAFWYLVGVKKHQQPNKHVWLFRVAFLALAIWGVPHLLTGKV